VPEKQNVPIYSEISRKKRKSQNSEGKFPASSTPPEAVVPAPDPHPSRPGSQAVSAGVKLAPRLRSSEGLVELLGDTGSPAALGLLSGCSRAGPPVSRELRNNRLQNEN